MVNTKTISKTHNYCYKKVKTFPDTSRDGKILEKMGNMARFKKKVI